VSWSNGIAEWVENDTAFISVAFSWKLPEAYQRAVWHKSNGLRVRVGGGGAFYHKTYFDGVADYGGRVDALVRHNPQATKASEGCPIGCYFCTVPHIEGKTFTLLPDFTPRPVLCDNNLSALPDDYQDYIIQKYIDAGVPLLDANSGFEPRSFTDETYHRWKKINQGRWRFAFDELDEEDYSRNMADILRSEQAPMKKVYVLIGNEPVDSCLYRINRVIEWGCEPHVQPMMALNTLEKKPMIKFDWTERKLKDMARWANRWLWRSMQFSEYDVSLA
jgi:hypothetical protein